MKIQISRAQGITALVIFLTALLLMGQRVGYPWAGGSGVRQNVQVQNILSSDAPPSQKRVYQRGETITTDELPQAISFGDFAQIALDARTDVRIERLTPDSAHLTLLRGRIVIATTPRAKEVAVKTTLSTSTLGPSSRGSFVNYDFQELVSVIPLGSTIRIETKDDRRITTIPLNINEGRNPPTFDPFVFDPSKDHLRLFYEFANSYAPPTQ